MNWKPVKYGAKENLGCFDNGNGALAYIDENPAYPGIERVRVVPYANGRGPARTFYRLAEDAAGAYCRPGTHAYATRAEAAQALRLRNLEITS